ncbi:soluble lytic murein transglycosylase-like protein [Caulobacter rhizosphaerae]|uniref:Soluble lytic murein transglycosylase-like protein n=1 Tax=Caulobacter rhizosphaerae TaxID=2010972 RepID=A0ABU1MWI4_9CAUL|nr:lytic transglycosylase domain-containing protein [Caulobacter rhizosphaerae]MDR6530276.1 soluble lytic murein transglycosylase-like protein [Caulobacter rhizosphaerae]
MTGSARAQDGVRGHVEAAAARFDLPSDLIEAVIAAESGGRARAVSPAGAMGLMQLMPGTWSDLRARLGLGADPFDPADNILAGAAYLRDLLDRYGAPGFLAAYNAGPTRYEASLAGRPLPLETRLYVARLSGMQGAAGLVRPDWRAAGLFPPVWSQGLRAAGATAVGAPASSSGDEVFTARRETGQ